MQWCALAGFYATEIFKDHIFLENLYVQPNHQGQGVGGQVISDLKRIALEKQFPIRLGALRKSRSKEFYRRHGFRKTYEEEWDIRY